MIFTNEQVQILNAIKSGVNVFITGPGGTGKSTIIKHVANETRMKEIPIGVTAMTGAAAVLINGQTLHSFLGIGLGKESVDSLVQKIMKRSKIKKIWETLDMLIVDEVSMLSAELLTKLNNVAKEVRGNDKVFGGIQLIFSGDFLQLPCIKGEFCFECKDWDECQFKIFHLQHILRQNDARFQQCLNNARFGKVTEEDIEFFLSETEAKLKPELFKKMEIKPTKILCHNADVNEINRKKLQKLPANEIKEYNVDIEYTNFYNPHRHKFLFQDISKLCNAQPDLFLAIGAQVMLLINKDTKNGLVNGSRGVVVEFTKNELPVVLFKNGTKMEINFHNYEVHEGKSLIAVIYQIPLKLAYAITVHKSQGMTLDSAVIDLKGVFEYGQAYVALSRVKNVDSLFLTNAVVSSFKAHPKAINFYKINT
jgi:ATP-dependent DNA helicase PIF1